MTFTKKSLGTPGVLSASDGGQLHRALAEADKAIREAVAQKPLIPE